jgi:phospholipid/cholesterol/gamma-HCH transport system ATP-binding protein
MRFPRGKVVAVMGGSGCGKTTVMRLIGGMVRPQRGASRSTAPTSTPWTRRACMRSGARWACCSSLARCSPTVGIRQRFPLREHTDLPESMIRDLVLMKLNAVGCAARAT